MSTSNGPLVEVPRPPEDVLKEPDLPPSPILDPDAYQVVVGILEKYVNLGKGWRKRLFVLHRGLLRYYKLESPAHENSVPGLLESLGEVGSLKLVGNELPLLHNRIRSNLPKMEISNLPSDLTCQGELHVQVATFRDTQSGDSKRFSIFSGTKKLSCRAESELDKDAWLEALQCSKDSWGHEDGHGRALFPSPEAKEPIRKHQSTKSLAQKTFDNSTLPEVKRRLREGNVSVELSTFLEDILIQQHRFYMNYMTEEAEKKKQILHYVRHLEEEKRQLEQQLVVSGRRDNLSEVGSIVDDRNCGTEQASGSELDEERDSDDGSDIDDNDIFFECDTYEQHGVAQDGDIDTNEPLKSQSLAPCGEVPPYTRTSTQDDARDLSAANHTVAPHYSPEMQAAIAAMDKWLRADGLPPTRRDKLPIPLEKEKAVSLWSIIKSCVGKDLTRVCLPVYFNEPLSALQKSAEDMEYSELLDQAIRHPKGSVERLLYIAAFAVSGYAATEGRTNKPFNPLLGETFEFVNAEKGYRFIGEKVIHHPTVFAFHCEGRGWTIDADGEIKNRFYGAGLEIRPVGSIEVSTADGEKYQWNKVYTTINNLILGKLYVDHYGIMKVKNQTTGLIASVKITPSRKMFERNPHQVHGHVENENGKVAGYSLKGTWSKSLMADFGDGLKEIWSKSLPAEDPTRYGFSKFAIVLNELTDGLESKIAPTDCRLRPDQQCLEIGKYDQANFEKQRLEHKQRAARKAADEGESIEPRWFDRCHNAKQGDELLYKYNGGYWKSRDEGCFKGCRDIFGQ